MSDKEYIQSPGQNPAPLPLSAKLLAVLALVIAAAMMLFVEPIPQWPEYHLFADTRSLLDIPNALNVLSNLGFVFVGAWGLWLGLARPWKRPGQLRAAYMMIFLGVLLTAFGSGWYHLEPTNERLVWDRLPMSITAMALLATAISEFINSDMARRMLWPLIILGMASVLWWGWTESQGMGDLRPYALVQFLPAVLIVSMMILYRSPADFILAMVGMIFFYGLAKLCEHFDVAIYQTLGSLSGHSLKHFFAAIAGAFVLFLLYRARGNP
jgi:hypothetical protein